MSLLESKKTAANSATELRYSTLSLVELATEIVKRSDRRALEEFHNNRTLFRYGGENPLRFIDYLNELRASAAKRLWAAPKAFEVADKAYDLTIDKFNNLPGKKKSSLKAKRKTDGNMKRNRTDCRLYFKAFLKRVAWSFANEPPGCHIEEEALAAMIFQGLVRRNFYRSLLEAVRKANPFWSRYNWMVKGRTISLWLPVSLRGWKRREWLENNMEEPDPLREGERERIQLIIDSKLVRERFVECNEDTWNSNEDENPERFDSGEPFGKSLAEAVAEEKVRNIHLQRWSIRALGERGLKKLVLRIFENLDCGEYMDRKIARDFGLSKATFSRFAGSRWLEAKSAIPDLWRNTAEVLSTHPDLKEVAIRTGVWNEVKAALEKDNQDYGKEPAHD